MTPHLNHHCSRLWNAAGSPVLAILLACCLLAGCGGKGGEIPALEEGPGIGAVTPQPGRTVPDDTGRARAALPSPVPAMGPSESPRGGAEYRLHPGDVIDISVYREPDLARTVTIDEGGTISFPLLDRVSLAGMTRAEAASKLRDLLAQDFIRDPQVSLEIKQRAKWRVVVSGEVNKPGIVEVEAGKTLSLLEAIAIAGGTRPEADLAGARLVRRPVGADAEPQIVPVGEMMVNPGAGGLDLQLQEDDLVVVSSTGQRRVTVMGSVKTPGTFALPQDGTMTVLQAVAKAGGVTQVASPNKTRVLRELDGRRETINVRLGDLMTGSASVQDVELIPNDVIVVPESVW